MKSARIYSPALHKLLIPIPIVLFLMTAGCGGSSSSGAGMAANNPNIFDPTCGPSDPDFPFCGRNLVGCRDETQIFYVLFCTQN